MDPRKLSIRQRQTLAALREKAPDGSLEWTAAELSEHSNIPHSTVVEALRRLHGKGMVQLRLDDDPNTARDRRQLMLWKALPVDEQRRLNYAGFVRAVMDGAP